MAATHEEMENVEEIQERLRAFDESLTDVERVFRDVLAVPSSELREQLTTLESAKFDLVGSFAMTSLFWMYLNVNGVNVKEHPIKQELERIKTYMGRAREIHERVQAPRLNKDASKRFVRNALWDAAQRGAATPRQPPTPPTRKRSEVMTSDEPSTQTTKKRR